MAEQTLLSLAIDPRKHRIRIHKATIHALGDPKWIQLLFNAEDLVLVVRAARQRKAGGHEIRIRPQEICGQDFELHSSLLIDHIMSRCNMSNDDNTYRLIGSYSKNNCAVFFPFSTMARIDGK